MLLTPARRACATGVRSSYGITMSTRQEGRRTIVVHGLGGLHQFGRLLHRAAGVGVAVEAREIAARNLQADAVAFQEDVGGDAGVDGHAVDLAGHGRLGLLQRVAIAQAQDAVGQVARLAVGEHVHQLGREIGVVRAGRHVQHHLHRPDHLQIVLQRLGGVDQHVFALLHGTLVHRPPGEDSRVAAHCAAARRHGLYGSKTNRSAAASRRFFASAPSPSSDWPARALQVERPSGGPRRRPRALRASCLRPSRRSSPGARRAAANPYPSASGRTTPAAAPGPAAWNPGRNRTLENGGTCCAATARPGRG